MKDTYKRLVLLCALVASIMYMAYGQEGQSQQSVDSRFTIAECYLQTGITDGQLRRNMPRNLWGGTFGVLRQGKPEQPHFWGGRMEFQHHSSARAIGFDTLRFTDLDYRTSSNSVVLAAVYRFYLPRQIGPFAPFVDASIGGRFLYTFTTTAYNDGTDDSNFDYDLTRLTLHFGFGAGLQMHIMDDVFASAKVAYQWSPSTSYLARTDEPNFPQSSRDFFERRSTPFTVITIDLGINCWW